MSMRHSIRSQRKPALISMTTTRRQHAESHRLRIIDDAVRQNEISDAIVRSTDRIASRRRSIMAVAIAFK